ncbi:MAG: transcriptional regulator [Candidatus Bathyarchaeota archaeon]|nr:MAG: transcriptional regulator [Candidatus Bathyarchaeota archaeon]
MSKDQAIGGAIFIVCLLVAIFYLVTLFWPQLFIDVIGYVGLTTTVADVKFWIIAIPVFVAFMAVLFIGAWIGWTMATTPPPKPIEEITTEIEERKEEMKVEEPAETKMPEASEEEREP